METNTPQPQQNQPPAKEARRKTLLRIVISILVIAVGIFALLFVVSRAAHYESIGSMLRHMWGELVYMWQNRLRG